MAEMVLTGIARVGIRPIGRGRRSRRPRLRGRSGSGPGLRCRSGSSSGLWRGSGSGLGLRGRSGRGLGLWGGGGSRLRRWSRPRSRGRIGHRPAGHATFAEVLGIRAAAVIAKHRPAWRRWNRRGRHRRMNRWRGRTIGGKRGLTRRWRDGHVGTRANRRSRARRSAARRGCDGFRPRGLGRNRRDDQATAAVRPPSCRVWSRWRRSHGRMKTLRWALRRSRSARHGARPGRHHNGPVHRGQRLALMNIVGPP